MEYRIEHDSMGEVRVPADRYWGAQTQRSVENFPIGVGLETMPREITHAFGILKKAAAMANHALKPEKMTAEKLAECEAQGRETIMADMVAAAGKVSGRTAFDAKRKGDEAGAEVVAKYVHYLAQGLSNIINIFQPEVLSIGGGVSGEGDYLLDMLIPLIRAEVYGQGIVKGTDIRIAALGNDAGIIGGAVLGLK